MAQTCAGVCCAATSSAEGVSANPFDSAQPAAPDRLPELQRDQRQVGRLADCGAGGRAAPGGAGDVSEAGMMPPSTVAGASAGASVLPSNAHHAIWPNSYLLQGQPVAPACCYRRRRASSALAVFRRQRRAGVWQRARQVCHQAAVCRERLRWRCGASWRVHGSRRGRAVIPTRAAAVVTVTPGPRLAPRSRRTSEPSPRSGQRRGAVTLVAVGSTPPACQSPFHPPRARALTDDHRVGGRGCRGRSAATHHTAVGNAAMPRRPPRWICSSRGASLQ